jgi:hypothetical protein
VPGFHALKPSSIKDVDGRNKPTSVRLTQRDYLSAVMAGLVPAIHVFFAAKEGVDGRDKRGHDD